MIVYTVLTSATTEIAPDNRISSSSISKGNSMNMKVSSAMVIPKIENPIWAPVLKKSLAPTEDEISLNRRSRSAKLRVAERIGLLPFNENQDMKDIEQENDVYLDKTRNRSKKAGKPMMGAKQLAKEAKRRALEEQENNQPLD